MTARVGKCGHCGQSVDNAQTDVNNEGREKEKIAHRKENGKKEMKSYLFLVPLTRLELVLCRF